MLKDNGSEGAMGDSLGVHHPRGCPVCGNPVMESTGEMEYTCSGCGLKTYKRRSSAQMISDGSTQAGCAVCGTNGKLRECLFCGAFLCERHSQAWNDLSFHSCKTCANSETRDEFVQIYRLEQEYERMHHEAGRVFHRLNESIELTASAEEKIVLNNITMLGGLIGLLISVILMILSVSLWHISMVLLPVLSIVMTRAYCTKHLPAIAGNRLSRILKTDLNRLDDLKSRHSVSKEKWLFYRRRRERLLSEMGHKTPQMVIADREDSARIIM